MKRPIHKSTSIHFLGNVVSNGFQVFRTSVIGIFDSIVLLLWLLYMVIGEWLTREDPLVKYISIASLAYLLF